jgi:PGF-pre-PGF domain-containing protein
LSGEKTPVPVAGAPAGTVIEAFGNVAKYEVKGKPGVFIWVTLLHSPNPIDQVLGMFTEDVENVITSVVTAGATKPNLAPALPNGLVATQYFYVTPDVAPEKIKKGLISFFVEKSWLEENGFHKWSVVLYRLNSVTNEWQALQAQLVSENATRVHYDAPVPGFSLFAITGGTEPASQDYTVAALQVSPAIATEGSTVTATAAVTNTGATGQTFVINLSVN